MKHLFLIFFLALGTASVYAKDAPINRVEPAFWWAGMAHHQVEIMVHGTGISELTPSSDQLLILGVTRTENPNYVFIKIETQGKSAGTYDIHFNNGKKRVHTISYALKQRRENSAHRVGFSSSDVIYLLMPDRFANGNLSNDSDPSTKEKANRSIPGGRHGGDLQGIADHLNYIKELGATAIWSTPLLEDNDAEYSYHTYGQSDLYRVDPRYGTNEEYCSLVSKCHQNGLKMIMDVVPNHWGAAHWMMNDLPTYEWIHQFPGYGQTNYRTSTHMDSHRSTRDTYYCEDGWFVRSMPDLNQRNPLVLNYLVQNTIWWIEYADLDGIRIDTYSFNDKEGIADWTKQIMNEYPNLNMVGEIWLHDQAQISYWQKDSPIAAIQDYNTNLPTVMDFTLHDAILGAFKENEQGWDKGVVRFFDNFSNDFLYQNPQNLLVFFENHDTQRFNEICPSLNDYKLALTLISTCRGIPQIYYGSEIGMAGKKEVGDADIRQDFPGGWPGDGINAFVAEDNKETTGFDRKVAGRTAEQEAYHAFTKKLLNWRKNSPVIHAGKMLHFIPENNVYVYFRILDKKVVMVLLNNSTTEQIINLSRYSEGFLGHAKGTDILSDQSFDLNASNWTLKAKTSYIIELR
jgi:glycosidase